MSFVNPAFLLALSALALPVIIHLLRRRRLQVVRWAAHRFLVESQKRTRQRIRFEDLLLLLLRCLLLALVVLAFARPVFTGRSGADAALATDPAQVVLLVDNSASLGWTDGVSSRLDAVRALADAELSELPSGATVALLAWHDRAQALVGRPTPDLALVRRELARVRPVARPSALAPALRAALDLLETLPPAPRRILVLGDRQALPWSDETAIKELVARAAEAKVSLDFKAPEAPPADNLAVTRLEAETAEAVVGRPLRFFAEVFNGGARPAENIRVTLGLTDGAPVAERTVARLEPGGRALVEFVHTFAAPGHHALSARVPADALAFDDSRALAVRVSPGLRVLLVEGPTTPGTRARPGFFLAEALAPVPAARKADYPVQVERVSPDELTPARLGSARVVILAGLPALAPAADEALAAFARAGGGVWVFPPATEGPAAAPSWLPLDFGAPTPASAPALSLAGPPYAHAIAALWDDPANGDLGALTIRRHRPLLVRPGDDAIAFDRVLRFSDGAPFLVGASLGTGYVLQSAVPADAAWSDLPLTPAFVPLVQRALASLQGGVAAPGALLPGDVFTQAVDPALLGREFLVSAPGRSGPPVPAGRVELVNGRATLRFSATSEPGLYRLFNDTDETPLAVFAVNPDASESDLTELDPARAALLSAAPGEAARAGAVSARRAIPTWLARDGWIVLASLALVLALAELVLAQRFSRAR